MTARVSCSLAYWKYLVQILTIELESAYYVIVLGVCETWGKGHYQGVVHAVSRSRYTIIEMLDYSLAVMEEEDPANA